MQSKGVLQVFIHIANNLLNVMCFDSSPSTVIYDYFMLSLPVRRFTVCSRCSMSLVCFGRSVFVAFELPPKQ